MDDYIKVNFHLDIQMCGKESRNAKVWMFHEERESYLLFNLIPKFLSENYNSFEKTKVK